MRGRLPGHLSYSKGGSYSKGDRSHERRRRRDFYLEGRCQPVQLLALMAHGRGTGESAGLYLFSNPLPKYI